MEMPGNFQLTAAYSYNDAEVTSSLYTYEVGERVNDVPQHMASAWGVKTVPLQEDMALRVGAGVRYIGNTVSTGTTTRSEEHTSELQSLICISYAVFCLKK